MFDIHSEIKSIKVSREQIVAIIESINSPMVAAANKPSESAKAFIVGVRNASGLFSIYIYLHLLQSKECLIYLHHPLGIPLESYHDMEVEALQFVESMGFIMDNLHFRDLAPEQQSKLMESIPVFYEDLDTFSRLSQVGEVDAEAGEEDGAEQAVLELDVVEPADIAEEGGVGITKDQVVSEEGIAKIIRLFSSF